MHELGITRRLLEVVLERAAAAGATRVTDVHLEIGEASDIAPEALSSYWTEVSRSTPAEGARLVFRASDETEAFRVVAIDVDDGPRATTGATLERSAGR
jgi:Zn finger protein HypA/HybF involved in hydrogenase expression